MSALFARKTMFPVKTFHSYGFSSANSCLIRDWRLRSLSFHRRIHLTRQQNVIITDNIQKRKRNIKQSSVIYQHCVSIWLGSEPIAPATPNQPDVPNETQQANYAKATPLRGSPWEHQHHCHLSKSLLLIKK